MLTNERVQRLIATDREALVELMALAHTNKLYGNDLALTSLSEDMRKLASEMDNPWRKEERMLQDWNREMSSLMPHKSEENEPKACGVILLS